MQILEDKDTLKLILDPKDVLIPQKYNYDYTDNGYDIALLGLSR